MLVHEAYLKLVDAKVAQWQDRAHFFALSARLMRRAGGAARAKEDGKRGGGAVRVEINESIDGTPLRRLLHAESAEKTQFKL
jgi:RNA polymerase sigma-70 factor (ECF subfamily)